MPCAELRSQKLQHELNTTSFFIKGHAFAKSKVGKNKIKAKTGVLNVVQAEVMRFRSDRVAVKLY